jgi:hypothetical protein
VYGVHAFSVQLRLNVRLDDLLQDAFHPQNGLVVLHREDDFPLHLGSLNAFRDADMARNSLVAFQGRSVPPDAGERILNVVAAVGSVGQVRLDDKKERVAILLDMERVVILPDKEHCCYVAALGRHYCAAGQVSFQAVAALERCCYVAALEHHYCAAGQVGFQAVAEPLHCYAVVLIARHSRLVVGLLAVAESWDVGGLLHLYLVARQGALAPVAWQKV